MPSPVGHLLGGIAAGWLLQPKAGSPAPHRLRSSTLVFALLGVAPDFDLLLGAHRGATHSLSAAFVVSLVAWLALRGRTTAPVRLAAACGAAYGSHVLLDWLATDGSPPIGIVALWPFSNAYYESPLHLFPAVSRRFGEPQLFWPANLAALTRELFILLPLVFLIHRVRRPQREA